jgi:subtilisin
MRRRPGRTALVALSLVAGMLSAGAAFPTANQSYIVVLDADTADVPAVAHEMARAHSGSLGFIYEHAIKGFSISLPPQAAAALARNPRVAYIETNDPVSISAQIVPTGVERIFADDNPNLGIDGTDDYRVDVDVAVIDTGVDFQHPDLNVVGGVTCQASGGGPPWARTFTCSSGGDDDHYHGTHVAGTIAAIDNGEGVVGVAPGARIWAVKVLDSNGSGYEAQVVAGIDWVAANAATIEVANMSLGGSGFSQAEYDAIQGAVDAGVAFAVAAGNSDADAANYSPAAFDNVLTVSALADFDGAPGGLGSPTCRTDQDDTLADFSNWGSAVDIAAPGVCILSTFPIEQGSYGTISGTSMASPHAAGALALLASVNNPGNETDVFNLYDAVINAGNFNWIDDSGDGIKEPLLDVSDADLFDPVLVGDGGGDDGEPPANEAPNASFTASCTGLTCSFTDTSTDSDGSVVEWSWNFGDGSSSTGQHPSHTYSTSDTYTVTLTVTDDDGATDTATQQVTVNSDDGDDGTEGELVGSSVNNGSTWTAVVTDTSENNLTGTWNLGEGSCDANVCELSGIPKRTGSATFTSGGTSVTVNKP